jgi:hypothetical protein
MGQRPIEVARNKEVRELLKQPVQQKHDSVARFESVYEAMSLKLMDASPEVVF